MILCFADLERLRLALVSGAVPPAVAQTAAAADVADDGRVHVRPSVEPTKKSLLELRRLGVEAVKGPAKLPLSVGSWLELFPLERVTDALERPELTPVLFDLPGGEQLAPLVTEVLRLRNDRITYRWLEEPRTKGGGRALLRVVGPPYYSLLRALESDGSPNAPVAYVEQASRVWVQFGYRHPLGSQIKPPAGQMLLLQPPRQWTFLDEAPFRDIYEALEFALPTGRTRWREGELPHRLRVPLRLTRGGAAEPAELWVVRDDPVEQLDALVRDADDHLLARLAFAVGDKDGQKTIVLRVRPSRLPPPVLVLRGIGFRPYLKMGHLFLPVGQALHPPLRRDAVRQHLADDPGRITWLYPTGDGGFVPESLPDDAFRPLADWIDYVLENEHQPLTAWIESHRFEFETFLTQDEVTTHRPRKPPKPPREPRAEPSVKVGREAKGEKPANPAADETTVATAPAPVLSEPAASAAAAPPDHLRQQLKALEEQFLAVEGNLDVEERRRLWPALAELNDQLGSADDAGVCWVNHLWLQETAPPAVAERWLRAEARPLSAKLPLSGKQLDRLLATAEPATAEARAVAAYAAWAGAQPQPAADAVARLGALQSYLERHERLVPVRAVWLAWLGLTRLAGDDALALARARDRLLERLFQTGLRPEQDLPSFLRFSGPASNQRFRSVRHWLVGLRDRAQLWARERSRPPSPPSTSARTSAYIDLLFAFGLGRLGEIDASNQLLNQASAQLTGTRRAHEFLLRAYTYRVRQAQESHPHAGPLPADLMGELPQIHEERKKKNVTTGVGDDYIIDRLRQVSRILEPDQKIAPLRHAIATMNDVDRVLQGLADELDRSRIVASVHDLLERVPRGDAGATVRLRILRDALDQAPRVGEEFALELLAQVAPAVDAVPEAPEHFDPLARLLERATFVAAHYDRVEYIQQMVQRFQRLLQSPHALKSGELIELLAAQAFRGLRKLGMGKEIDHLLNQMAGLLLQGATLKKLDPAWGAQNPDRLRALLHVASGWLYFGRDAEAEAVLRLARAVLLSPPPAGSQDVRKRTLLACAYASALSQAPIEAAQTAWDELFDKVEGIYDTWTTHEFYLLTQLMVVEAVVLAVVSDDFTVGTTVRRWLDDEELLVRRRIHQDVRNRVKM